MAAKESPRNENADIATKANLESKTNWELIVIRMMGFPLKMIISCHFSLEPIQ